MTARQADEVLATATAKIEGDPDRARPPSAPRKKRAAASDVRFGQVALSLRLLTDEELATALDEQRRRARRAGHTALADVLLEQGVLTDEGRDLVVELEEHAPTIAPARQEAGRAPGEGDRLGRILVESGLVSEAQIQDALELQRELKGRAVDRRLGDLLVLQGVLERPALETVLKAQAVRRKVTPKRRPLLREELLPDHPLTVAVGAVIALILVMAYVSATGGASLLRGTADVASRVERGLPEER
jgi:hypothetical protein